MPLTQRVSFNTTLQLHDRISVPKIIRSEFKLETSQVLKVGVNDITIQSGWHFFFSKMTKDGRIIISHLTLKLLEEEENTDFTGHVLEVSLEPSQV